MALPQFCHPMSYDTAPTTRVWGGISVSATLCIVTQSSCFSRISTVSSISKEMLSIAHTWHRRCHALQSAYSNRLQAFQCTDYPITEWWYYCCLNVQVLYCSQVVMKKCIMRNFCFSSATTSRCSEECQAAFSKALPTIL